MENMNLYLTIILAPLVASIIVGFFGNKLGKLISHSLPILGVLIAFICSCLVFYKAQYQGLFYNGNLYTWLSINNYTFSIGLLIDKLT